jgi:protein-S-isoprenylcysteine O-methyltransferase Ste14
MKRTLRTSLASTSTRTFVLWPILAIAIQVLARRPLRRRYVPLLAWGYGQYRWAGAYRNSRGGGGPGMSRPPERLVTSGVYGYTRNPMYLGHLIFLAGLALVFRSPTLGALLGWHLHWFDQRAAEDERQLDELFGAEYARYRETVPRWLPGTDRPRESGRMKSSGP